METIDGRQRPAALIRTLLCNPSQPLQFQRDSGLHTGTIVLYHGSRDSRSATGAGNELHHHELFLDGSGRRRNIGRVAVLHSPCRLQSLVIAAKKIEPRRSAGSATPTLSAAAACSPAVLADAAAAAWLANDVADRMVELHRRRAFIAASRCSLVRCPEGTRLLHCG